MNTNTLRQLFLDYFYGLKHDVVSSSALVPDNDSTLLFTNAGMVQFKNVFLGEEKRPYQRATSAQRCVRAGGKHNDLENVGYTARHHTFFEMLGNFSFGDYFKREAIQYAWDFLTLELNLPPEKLWVTVYKEDDEAARIWLEEIKINPGRLTRLGESSNFWSMGDTGPCGPCSEIFYDHGPTIKGGPPGSVDEEGDRYVEIWNLVFMQFNRDVDRRLTPLPKPSVDTGMGLERIAAIMQGVHNNYDIDLFQKIIQAIIKQSHCKDHHHSSIRVIADHIRSVSFLIADGVRPSNEGRGYVLRRIMRRAIRHGNKLGLHEAFFYKLALPLVEEMGAAYPILQQRHLLISETIHAEEILFSKTLEQGLKIFEQQMGRIKNNIIPGPIVFLLYDTYGFPPDLTADIARERNLSIDQEGFDLAMSKQRELSHDASKFGVTFNFNVDFAGLNFQPSQFAGYESVQNFSKIMGLFKEAEPVSQLNHGEKGFILLDCTPFYAEAGGQVGDQGIISLEGKSSGSEAEFSVRDTQKQGDFYLHYGVMKKGSLKVNDGVNAQVKIKRRQAIELNHSATHLLHAALRELLGTQVVQKGSLVKDEYLRFDFLYPHALINEQIKIIEEKINEKVRENLLVKTQVMALEEARKQGTMALFGEKYSEQVRVLSMGEFSVEFCGGTHVNNTGEIGLFKIISETGIAAGIRRIEAVTGRYALEWLQKLEGQLNIAAQLLKTDHVYFLDKLTQILDRNRHLEKKIEQLQHRNIHAQLDILLSEARNLQGIKILAGSLPNVDSKTLRSSLDLLKQKLKYAVLVLASIHEGKIILVCSVSQNYPEKINAGELLAYVAEQIGGKAGGRPDMAQGGGGNPQALPAALESVYTWVEKKICP